MPEGPHDKAARSRIVRRAAHPANVLDLSSSPIVTANRRAQSSERWTVPLGGAVGKIFHLGKLPVNAQLGAYYNVVKPDAGANWQIRAQVQLMFPKLASAADTRSTPGRSSADRARHAAHGTRTK